MIDICKKFCSCRRSLFDAYLMEIVLCSNLEIRADKKVLRRNQSRLLRETLRENPASIRIEHYFVAQLPDVSDHRNHVIGPVRFTV